jgi:hypothetical protein
MIVHAVLKVEAAGYALIHPKPLFMCVPHDIEEVQATQGCTHDMAIW